MEQIFSCGANGNLCLAGVQKLFHPTKTDGSSRSKFGARGEHGEHGKWKIWRCSPVFPLRCSPVLQFRCFPVLKGSQEQFFPPDTLFTAFVATVQKINSCMLGAHDPGSAQDVVVIYAALA